MTRDPTIQQLIRPWWMDNPAQWSWFRPDGIAQGFPSAYWEHVGAVNLLWLCMPDLAKPPSIYDARQNPLYMWVVAQPDSFSLLGQLSLPKFIAKTASSSSGRLLQLRGKAIDAHARTSIT